MKHKEKYMLIICWVTYLVAYMCRVNMASALPRLETAFSADAGHWGLTGSLYFFVYACGQLINGILGDRVNPYRYVAVASAGAMGMNLIVSFSSNVGVILVCWTLNGYFQSMFWGPMLRILAFSYPESENGKVSVWMSISYIMGYIFSWVVVGSILSGSVWNLYFLVPAVCMLPVFIVWTVLYFRKRHITLPQPRDSLKKSLSLRGILKTISEEKLQMVVIVCICTGLIRESISLWLPVIMLKALGFDYKSSPLMLAIIPLANLGGIVFARRLFRRFTGDIMKALILLASLLAGGCALLFIFNGASGFADITMIAFISAMTFGCGSLLLANIPLSFSHKNIVSTLVGIFDFSSYIGAAIAAFVLGLVLSGDSWTFIPVIWLLVAIVAVVFLWSYSRKTKASKASKV